MLKYALLELLAHADLTGYDINKRFRGSINFFWHARPSQVYSELRRLEAAGWIEATDDAGTRRSARNRNIYRITARGRTALREWLATPTPLTPEKDEMQLKVFGSDLISPAEILANFRYHLAQHRERLDTLYRDKQAIDLHFGPTGEVTSLQGAVRQISVDYGIGYEDHYVRWCEAAIGALERLVAAQLVGPAAPRP